MHKTFKLIIIICILFMCGIYPVNADDTYSTTGVYTFSDSSSNTYQLTMPVQEFYPHVSSGVVNNTLVMGATQYTISQQIQFEDLMLNSYLGSTVITGTRQGWLDSYAQRFDYVSSVNDRYRVNFHLMENRGGSGTVTVLYYKNNNWVEFGTYDFNGTYSGEFYVKEINGYRFEVRYTLTNRFAFARADDAYTDGYKLNTFSFEIESSKDYQERALDNINDSIQESNGLLDNIKDKIDDVIDDITGLPDTILNGLKDLFIPDDFTSLLTDNISDLTDSLGFLGFPLAFINDLITTIIDADSLIMAVSVPSIGSPWGTLYPGYSRSNILYWVNYNCFSNLGSSAMFSSLLSMLGLNYNSTILTVIHAFTNIALFLALLRLAVNKYNDIFGTDIDSGGDDD